jgi:hypothetical protein
MRQAPFPAIAAVHLRVWITRWQPTLCFVHALSSAGHAAYAALTATLLKRNIVRGC